MAVFGDSFAFNFDTGEFVTGPKGAFVRTTQDEALKEWIRKTLATPRFEYSIYPDWYGSLIEDAIGRYATTSIVSDVERHIKEALMVDARVRDVGNFSSTIADDQLHTRFTVLSASGEIIDLANVTEVRP